MMKASRAFDFERPRCSYTSNRVNISEVKRISFISFPDDLLAC